MTADRKLLELAAKAIGLEVIGNNEEGLIVVDRSRNNRGNVSSWRPHNDDGDSRRLQVDLGIRAWYERNAPPELNLPQECGLAQTTDQWFAAVHMDPRAAVRMAVLQCAAAIGEAMP